MILDFLLVGFRLRSSNYAATSQLDNQDRSDNLPRKVSVNYRQG
jgi:hypothetical protein